MIYALVFLVMPVDYDALIVQLGSMKYDERVSATNQLYKLSPESIPYLKRAFNHSDPEIKYKSRYIVGKIREVYPSYRNGVAIPLSSIWNLPNEIRFQDGEDVALKYYNKVFVSAYTEATTIDYGAMPEWQVRQLAEQQTEIIKKSALIRHFTGLDIKPIKYVYSHDLAQIWATAEYIGDCREKGMRQEDAVAILDKMVSNSENMCHLTYSGELPGILVDKRIKEHLNHFKYSISWLQQIKNQAYKMANVYLLKYVYK